MVLLNVEHKLLPEAVRLFCDGKLIVDGEMTRIIKDKSLEETFMELVVDE